MNQSFIYESPDGGKTVYARKFGCKERILVNTETTREQQLWSEILEAGKTNAAIQKALDRVIILYKLTIEKQDDRKDPT